MQETTLGGACEPAVRTVPLTRPPWIFPAVKPIRTVCGITVEAHAIPDSEAEYARTPLTRKPAREQQDASGIRTSGVAMKDQL